MIICICKGISESKLQKEIEKIHKEKKELILEEIKKHTNIGTQCGLCLETVIEILDKNNLKASIY